jgi:ATP-dependent Zn protease
VRWPRSTRDAERRAVTLLTDRRDALDRLTELLLERETVDSILHRRLPIGPNGLRVVRS